MPKPSILILLHPHQPLILNILHKRLEMLGYTFNIRGGGVFDMSMKGSRGTQSICVFSGMSVAIKFPSQRKHEHAMRFRPVVLCRPLISKPPPPNRDYRGS